MPGPAERGNRFVMRPVTASLAALVLIGTAWSAPAADMRVSPARQAERDGLRRQILAQELASEEQALARAEQRLAERRAANDPQGMQEADDARRIHARNLDALRAEIARTGSPFVRAALRRPDAAQAGAESRRSLAGGGPDTDRLRHTPSHSPSASATESAATAAGPSPRWWDAYGPSATGTPISAKISGSPVLSWAPV